jgi:probable addiction module antidote protein
MTDTKFNPEDMPILDLDMSGTSLYEASSYLDTPEIMAAYIAESMKSGDSAFIHAVGQVAKAKGVNNLALEAGLNRESLYKLLKGGAKTRYETIRKLMAAIGLELTVRPIATPVATKGALNQATDNVAAKPSAAKALKEKPPARSATDITKKRRTSSKEPTATA